MRLKFGTYEYNMIHRNFKYHYDKMVYEGEKKSWGNRYCVYYSHTDTDRDWKKYWVVCDLKTLSSYMVETIDKINGTTDAILIWKRKKKIKIGVDKKTGRRYLESV